ncbi:NBR1-Ig-like domain-containing protein [Nonomuraea typhae]|uniref:NBR1-Ig-like domain-containing protein n=1 Tax=Nonomuraea typhae TaxID=2603600 RepID=A0ABW7YV97_9ACTN
MDDRRARAEAIEDFAATLRDLRNSVGNPPFREMSGRSGAISHTTLHEAVKANRLPSWETTVEFVKACGADPAAYREQWERANLAVRSVSTAALAGEEPPAPAVRQSGGRFRPVLIATGASVVLGAVVLVVIVVNRDSTPAGLEPNPSAAGPSSSPSSTGCPVRWSTPPPAEPLYPGDASQFLGDVTLPDCTHVGASQTLTKIWRFKNAGSVPWKGYSLLRLDDSAPQAGQCQTVSKVPVNETRPGEMVDIRTDVTTPTKAGLCYARFKMVDASGKVVFPGKRPVTFQIIVNTR